MGCTGEGGHQSVIVYRFEHRRHIARIDAFDDVLEREDGFAHFGCKFLILFIKPDKHIISRHATR